MPEFAEGGIVEDGEDLPDFIRDGCDYIIPRSFADRWKEALDKLNEDGVG